MQNLVLFVIRIYQSVLSPYLGFMCRHEPTCSNYAYEAISRHGFLPGLGMTFIRLLNCRPFGNRGYDPVP